MNSGIQFRSESSPDYQNGRVHGYQMEIDPSRRAWSGGIYEEGRAALVVHTGISMSRQKRRLKTGNGTSTGLNALVNSIRTWVNDIPAASLIDEQSLSRFYCPAGPCHW